jgi:hypothetical protein
MKRAERREQMRFGREAEELEKDHGISNKEARKDIFLGRLDNVAEQIDVFGGVGAHGQGMIELEAAFGAMFGPAALHGMQRAAGSLRGLPKPKISKKELLAVHKHFKESYGFAPPFALLRETAQYNKMLQENVEDFLTSTRSITGVRDFAAYVKSNPVMQKKLGVILLLKNKIISHEKRFERELEHERRVKDVKSSFKESLSAIFWKGPIDLMHKYGKASHIKDRSTRYGKYLGLTMNALIKDGFHLGKLLATGAGAIATKAFA